MKTIEDKAKTYDGNYKVYTKLINRLEDVKGAIKKQNYGIAMDILCKDYPEFQITTSTELEESDEWIKNEIIAFVEQSIHRGGGTPIPQEQENKWIAWLEKREFVGEIVERCKTSWYNEGKIQGQIEGLSDEEKYQQGWHDALEKQGKLIEEYEDRLDRCACESFNKGYKAAIEHQKEKFADKIEPKFKVGDLVVDNCGYVWKIEGILNQFYLLEGVEGGESRPTIEWVNKTFHLWNINDAKDGDILADEYGIYIFNNFDSLDDKLFICKCAYEYSKKVFEIGGMLCGKTDVYPATKEQRDLLFQKMKEASYEWDSEKKELKKIEHDVQLTEFEDAIKDMVNDYRDAIGDNDATIEEIKKHSAYLLSLIHQKPDWSEEDDNKINSIKYLLHKLDNYNFDNWLKSLKDRVQPKQEWSEEDEVGLGDAMWAIEQAKTIAKDENGMGNLWYAEHWLKSLKDRIHVQNLTVTDEELSQAKKDAYNDALDKIEYHSGEPTFDDGWDAAIWYLKKRNAIF